MKYVIPLVLAALSGCANPPAAENPNSVPNVLRSISEIRATQTHIYMQGGIYDGAAAGQTATFIITPDDSLICTFQFSPVLAGDGDVSTVTAHRLSIPGAYAALSGIILPNVEITEVEFTPNFTVETGIAPNVVSTRMGFGDPRFEPLITYFNFNPTPCWTFG